MTTKKYRINHRYKKIRRELFKLLGIGKTKGKYLEDLDGRKHFFRIVEELPEEGTECRLKNGETWYVEGFEWLAKNYPACEDYDLYGLRMRREGTPAYIKDIFKTLIAIPAE